eukprot:gnl/TRDRNA2_/TRDRNA2_177974_c0_seq3.p1 gnl/TRDRNA2_/TRDRNA2_177974_c0~~gnl/TRDRNA2_/TRDRNA2_177974_c0_seq3.p1  ORF type:complete len:658 (+),score=54.17 gnl/TRDRNA2_/TRDRNA2_177974_c0_seq3:126-1976(+)
MVAVASARDQINPSGKLFATKLFRELADQSPDKDKTDKVLSEPSLVSISDLPKTNASYVLPSNVDVVLKAMGLDELNFPMFGTPATPLCSYCGKMLPEMASTLLQGMLRRRQDNDPLPEERKSGKQQLLLYTFGAFPTAVHPWNSLLTEDRCIPGWRVVTTSKGVGTDGVQRSTPCRNFPGHERGSALQTLILGLNVALMAIRGHGWCSLKGRPEWDISTGSGAWTGASGTLSMMDLMRANLITADGTPLIVKDPLTSYRPLILEEMKLWAKELQVPDWSPSYSQIETEYYQLELFKILETQVREVPSANGIDEPTKPHEIKLGSFKHAFMNTVQVQADGPGIQERLCSEHQYTTNWGYIVDWPRSGINDEQMQGLATSNPDMFVLHQAYDTALDRTWMAPEEASLAMLYYLTAVQYLLYLPVFDAAARMIGWNPVAHAVVDLTVPDCMNEHGLPKSHLYKCRTAMNNEFQLMSLIQHPATLNCLLVFKGTSSAREDDYNKAHFHVPAKRYCGNRVHPGLVSHLKRVIGLPAFQDMRKYLLPKCRNVGATGHSLGGSDASVFLGCLHTGGQGDAKADYDDISWDFGATPELLPAFDETKFDCDENLHIKGWCDRQK